MYIFALHTAQFVSHPGYRKAANFLYNQICLKNSDLKARVASLSLKVKKPPEPQQYLCQTKLFVTNGLINPLVFYFVFPRDVSQIQDVHTEKGILHADFYSPSLHNHSFTFNRLKFAKLRFCFKGLSLSNFDG